MAKDRSYYKKKIEDKRKFKKKFKDSRKSKKDPKFGDSRSASASVSPHNSFPGLYVLKKGSKEYLATINSVPSKQVYNELLISLPLTSDSSKKVEFRIWNPFK